MARAAGRSPAADNTPAPPRSSHRAVCIGDAHETPWHPGPHARGRRAERVACVPAAADTMAVPQLLQLYMSDISRHRVCCPGTAVLYQGIPPKTSMTTCAHSPMRRPVSRCHAYRRPRSCPLGCVCATAPIPRGPSTLLSCACMHAFLSITVTMCS